MALIKMDPAAVAAFMQNMIKIKDENLELWSKVFSEERFLVGTNYIAGGAQQFEQRFNDIYNPLTIQFVQEFDELIQTVQNEIAQFEQTGSQLGF